MEIKFPIQILVKPDSNEDHLYYNKERQIYVLSIRAKAQDNKANIEVIKFLSRLFKKRIKIVRGFKAKLKLVDVV